MRARSAGWASSSFRRRTPKRLAARDINTRTVDVHVRRLRVSLGPAADTIETVHGFGYRAKRDGA